MVSKGFANLRDVADGLPSGTLRKGVLFRSDAPMPDDPVPTLPGWPPSSVIDLRAPGELEHAHPFATSATVHSLSLLAAASPKDAHQIGVKPELLLRAYRSMSSPRTAALLVELVGIVATDTGSTLIHCAAGKDRTGVSVALILRLCDVDRALVKSEYMITDTFRDRLIERLGRYLINDQGVRVAPDALFASPAGLDSVLDVWAAHAGGATGWYMEHGGDANTVSSLRKRLLP